MVECHRQNHREDVEREGETTALAEALLNVTPCGHLATAKAYARPHATVKLAVDGNHLGGDAVSCYGTFQRIERSTELCAFWLEAQ